MHEQAMPSKPHPSVLAHCQVQEHTMPDKLLGSKEVVGLPLTLYSRTCSKKMMGLSLLMADLSRALELATVEQATSCTPGILWK